MKKRVLTIGGLIVLLVLCVIIYSFLTRRMEQRQTNRSSISTSDLNGSEISSAPINVQIRFEAVIVNRPENRCIELFIPDEFEKYAGDPKWAISSTLGFQPGLFDQVPEGGKGIVTGKYVFVRDVHDGPCGLVTGELFEIDEIEYF
jgi:hypothetical protein